MYTLTLVMIIAAVVLVAAIFASIAVLSIPSNPHNQKMTRVSGKTRVKTQGGWMER